MRKKREKKEGEESSPRVNAARAEEGDDVEGVVLKGGLDVLPAGVIEDAPLFQSDVNEGGTLGDNLTSTERVVPNLLKYVAFRRIIVSR